MSIEEKEVKKEVKKEENIKDNENLTELKKTNKFLENLVNGINNINKREEIILNKDKAPEIDPITLLQEDIFSK